MSRKNGERGASRPAWYEAGLAHVWLPYAQMKTVRAPLPVARTHGCRIVLCDGRELIDGIASWWTACHGYNHPHIRKAIEDQLALMPHIMFGGLAHEQALTLARRLAARIPGDLTRVFFSESGSVAVEIAMKMAVQFWLNQGVGKRYIVELPQSEESVAAFARRLERHAEELAGIIVEPLVQGAGGMRFHTPSVLQRLRAAADRYQLLLIFDEIFTGFGRTGSLFACEQAGVVPDIMTLSKALTGGTLALAVTVARDKVFDAFWSDDPTRALLHGPTFMGNALACAAANASLDLFEREPRLRQVADIAAALEQGLAPCRGLPGVKDVRVKGAIGVVELDRIDDLEAMRARFVEEGVFVRPFGSTIYLTPAFTIGEDELARLTAAVTKVVGKAE